jgi:hypothetical protein
MGKKERRGKKKGKQKVKGANLKIETTGEMIRMRSPRRSAKDASKASFWTTL